MAKFNELKTKKDRIAYIREAIANDIRWAYRALVVIYANQTSDEQSAGETKHHNSIGFTGADAEILSSFAEQHQQRGSLSPRQCEILQGKMPKYAKQLLESANAG